MRSKAKLTSKGKAKTVASPYEATLSGETILASPITKKKAFKAKPKASQIKRANFQSPRVSVMDRLSQLTRTWEIIWAISEGFTLMSLFTSRRPSADK